MSSYALQLNWFVDHNVFADAETLLRERPRRIAVGQVAQKFYHGDKVYLHDVVGVCVVFSCTKELTVNPVRITYSLKHAGEFIMKPDNSGIAWIDEDELMIDRPQTASEPCRAIVWPIVVPTLYTWQEAWLCAVLRKPLPPMPVGSRVCVQVRPEKYSQAAYPVIARRGDWRIILYGSFPLGRKVVDLRLAAEQVEKVAA